MRLKELEEYRRYKCLDLITGEYYNSVETNLFGTKSRIPKKGYLTDSYERKIKDPYATYLGHYWKELFYYKVESELSRYEFFLIEEGHE